MLFISGLIGGLISGLVAYKVGKWRHSCAFWMVRNRANLPLGWHKTEIRFGSWLLVAALSFVFATSWSLLIVAYVNTFLGMFAWGVLLAIRWLASGIAAHVEGQRDLQELERMMKERKDYILTKT